MFGVNSVKGLAYNPQLYSHPQFLPPFTMPPIHPVTNQDGQYPMPENPQLQPLDLSVNQQ